MNRMVTIPRKLFVDHLKSHLISDTGKKMGRNGINESNGATKRGRKYCGVSYTSKKRHWGKITWKRVNYGQRQESNDDKHRCKIIVKPENLHFKNKKITNVEIDELKENVTPNTCNDTENLTKKQMATKWSKLIHHTRTEMKKVTVLA